MNEKNIPFKFSYLALKLLGKNLYSNAWAALSELVANASDASATNIYIYIDMRNKRNSTIEVFDDGDGMSYSELENNYVHIGRNRRMVQDKSEEVMGRKGIGKLAALYLSRHYYISSKKDNEPSLTYLMDFTKEKENSNDEQPEMKQVTFTDFDNTQFLNYTKGTMIRMEEVDLKGYSDISIDSLNNVLSDFFSIQNMHGKKIFLKVVNSNESDQTFKEVVKKTPFKNMIKILCFDDDTFSRLDKEYNGNNFIIPRKKYSDHPFKGKTIVERVPNLTSEFSIDIDGNQIKKTGQIKGWLGIHSTIDTKSAKENDSQFKKNKLYNPLKLRVYVRNKLAIDNFLPVINNTQVFVNFIEGEINYDILDDNDFPDIATTSRQNMDENDGRIIELATKMKMEISKLISERNKLRKQIVDGDTSLDIESNNKAKESLSNSLEKAISKITKNTQDDFIKTEQMIELVEEVRFTALNNIQGENVKKQFKIFFSHSSRNKRMIDFFYYLLASIGVKENEMFYTSRTDAPEIATKQNLAEISKANIIDNNTIMFFYSSKDFKESEYCMFEGGAAWATRTEQDYYILFDDISNVPQYLNHSGEFLLHLDQDSDIFTGIIYNQIVQALNFLINHINIGREIRQESTVKRFEVSTFPDKIQTKEGVKPDLDERIIRYWQSYVIDAN